MTSGDGRRADRSRTWRNWKNWKKGPAVGRGVRGAGTAAERECGERGAVLAAPHQIVRRTGEVADGPSVAGSGGSRTGRSTRMTAAGSGQPLPQPGRVGPAEFVEDAQC